MATRPTWCLATLDVVDQELLAQARLAGERLIEAEHDADVARADFHRAVRRLHLSGASLRQLASELKLSHQRIHQIVEEAGGTRRWRVRDQQGALACSFCGRTQPRTKVLVAGPGVWICDGCIKLAGTVMTSGCAAQTPLGRLSAVPEDATDRRCSFCGTRRYQVSGLVISIGNPIGKIREDASICAECLSLCQEICAERRSSTADDS